ncbi:MAG: O-antigen ligase family protein [Candidatus Coatesbacteria bacterium]
MLLPRLVLCWLAACLPLALSFRWSVDPLAPKAAAWLIGGGLLLAVGPPLRWRPWPLVILVLLAALESLRGPASVWPLAPWLVGAVVYLRAREASADRAAVDRYIRLTVGVATAVAANGLGQAVWNTLFTSVRLVNPFGTRVLSTLGNPTFLADYLALHLPLALFLCASARAPRARLAWGTCAGMIGATIVLSGSKGGQLAALVAGGIWLALEARRRAWSSRTIMTGALAGAIAAVAVLHLVPSARSSLSRWTARSERFSFSQRLEILKGSAALLADSPLLGWGTGQFPVEFPRVQPDALSRTLGVTVSVNHAHDDFAEIACDFGLVGLLLVMFVLFRHLGRVREGGVPAALALSLVAMAVSMGTNFFVYLPSSAFFLWMHAGLLAGGRADPDTATPKRAKTALRLLALLLAIGAGRLLVSTGYYHFGAECVDRGDGVNGARWLERAVRVEALERHLWQYLGRAREIQRDWNGALTAYTKALALAPHHAIAWLNVGRIERERYRAFPLLRHGARARAIDALLHAVGGNPYMLEPRIWGGELALEAGEARETWRFLGEAPADLGGSPDWHRLRARWFEGQGNHRASGLERDKADALESRMAITEAEAALNAGRIGEAERRAREVTHRWPAFPGGWETLGFILHGQGRSGEARECYIREAKLVPDSLTAQLNLAMIALNARQPAPAEKYLTRALALAPDNPDVHLGLARLRAMQGRLKEAEAEYRRVLAAVPGHRQAAAELANLLAR